MSLSDLVSTVHTDEFRKAEATRAAIGELTANRARPMSGRVAALAGLGIAAVLPIAALTADFPTTITFAG